MSLEFPKSRISRNPQNSTSGAPRAVPVFWPGWSRALAAGTAAPAGRPRRRRDGTAAPPPADTRTSASRPAWPRPWTWASGRRAPRYRNTPWSPHSLLRRRRADGASDERRYVLSSDGTSRKGQDEQIKFVTHIVREKIPRITWDKYCTWETLSAINRPLFFTWTYIISLKLINVCLNEWNLKGRYLYVHYQHISTSKLCLEPFIL